MATSNSQQLLAAQLRGRDPLCNLGRPRFHNRVNFKLISLSHPGQSWTSKAKKLEILTMAETRHAEVAQGSGVPPQLCVQ